MSGPKPGWPDVSLKLAKFQPKNCLREGLNGVLNLGAVVDAIQTKIAHGEIRIDSVTETHGEIESVRVDGELVWSADGRHLTPKDQHDHDLVTDGNDLRPRDLPVSNHIGKVRESGHVEIMDQDRVGVGSNGADGLPESDQPDRSHDSSSPVVEGAVTPADATVVEGAAGSPLSPGGLPQGGAS